MWMSHVHVACAMCMSHVPPPTTQEHHKKRIPAMHLCTYPCTSPVTTFSAITLKATHTILCTLLCGGNREYPTQALRVHISTRACDAHERRLACKRSERVTHTPRPSQSPSPPSPPSPSCSGHPFQSPSRPRRPDEPPARGCRIR
jgi:hypothetical protein